MKSEHRSNLEVYICKEFLPLPKILSNVWATTTWIYTLFPAKKLSFIDFIHYASSCKQHLVDLQVKGLKKR